MHKLIFVPVFPSSYLTGASRFYTQSKKEKHSIFFLSSCATSFRTSAMTYAFLVHLSLIFGFCSHIVEKKAGSFLSHLQSIRKSLERFSPLPLSLGPTLFFCLLSCLMGGEKENIFPISIFARRPASNVKNMRCCFFPSA